MGRFGCGSQADQGGGAGQPGGASVVVSLAGPTANLSAVASSFLSYPVGNGGKGGPVGSERSRWGNAAGDTYGCPTGAVSGEALGQTVGGTNTYVTGVLGHLGGHGGHGGPGGAGSHGSDGLAATLVMHKNAFVPLDPSSEVRSSNGNPAMVTY